MEGAFAWINAIAEWLGNFIPRLAIVDTAHGAVKFVSFRLRWWKTHREVVKLGPGAHPWWPLATSFTIYPTARQATDLRAQTIVTVDNRTAIVGGLIVYEVEDVEKLVAYTFDPDDTIKDISLSAIHDACIQYTWDELVAGSRHGGLDRKMLEEARKYLRPYGVKVLKMTLTDLAPCRVYRLVQANYQIAGTA